MKVLLINNFHYIKGGSESVYFNMADMLTKTGHEVVFFSFRSENNVEYGANSYFVRPNSELNPLCGAIRYIHNGEAKRSLEQLIVAEKPDIAHIHLFWGGLSSSILSVLRKHHIPIVHTAHDYRMICPAYTFRRQDGTICEQCLGKKFYNALRYRCSKGKVLYSALMCAEMYFREGIAKPVEAIDGFVFVSDFSYRKHLQFIPELKDKQCIVAHNHIPQTKSEFISSSCGDYYLFFGRLSHEKGLKTLISAFSALPNCRLKIVGTGPQEEELKAFATTDNIEFVGYLSGDKLKQTIKECKFIIVPSEWYENNPMTIIEASAAGIPTIGATIGGIPEIVIEGKTGYLFTPKSIEELTSAIMRAEALTPERYAEMSSACRAMAAEKFSEESTYSKIMNLYSSILDSYES